MKKKLMLLSVVMLAALAFLGGRKFFEDGGAAQANPTDGNSNTQISQISGDVLGDPQSMIGLIGTPAFLVEKVTSGSPAEQAGLRPGDLVTWADGKPITCVTDIQQVSRKAPGQKVEFFLLRYNPNMNQHEALTVTMTTIAWKRPAN